MGSIPIQYSDFFLVPHSCHVDQFTFHIWLPSLKFTYHTHDEFDSGDPSSMQDACHIWTQLNEVASHELS